jgi:hypothetical protein
VDSILHPNTDCLPWWHARYAGLAAGRQYVVRSGCATVDGNVTCTPESMRAAAQGLLRSWGYWPVWRSLPLAAYTLARYMASEVGSHSLETRAAVGMAAINRVKLEKLADVNALLLYRQGAGNPHRGYYGPIHGAGGTGAPYGRWAATSQDPSLVDILLADFLLGGGDTSWARGADDQADLTSKANFPNPEGTVRSFGSHRSYWIGPLPGVDHRVTYLLSRRSDIDPQSDEGRFLIERGVAILSVPSPDWSGLGVCSRTGWAWAAAAGLSAIGISYALSGTWPWRRNFLVGPPSDR